MLDYIIILLIVFGIITIFFTYTEKDPVIALISSLIWLVVALGMLYIEIPWEMYNATSGNIETGFHTTDVMYLGYFFGGLALIMMISCFSLILESLRGKNPWD